MIARLPAMFFALVGLYAYAQPPEPPPNNLVYEIFVRSFADGDRDANGVGDLRGIADKLAYLNDGNPASDADLEVGILWLMPVFPSPSYHGYDVTDYRTINPEYGTLSDLQSLLAAAHSRHIRVILDVPFNHTSRGHPWFREAVKSPASPQRRFYFIEPDSGTRTGPWHRVTSDAGEKLRYLGIFSPDMPDLNFDNPEVRGEMKAIARFWLDLGVDGFRLDAAKHIYGATLEQLTDDDILHNNEWWREFSRSAYLAAPNATLLGEALGEPEMLKRHAWGLDGLLDEPFMNDVRSNLHHPAAGLVGRHKLFVDETRALNRTAYDASSTFPDQVFQAYPFVASHDRNPRLASDLEEMKRHDMPFSVDEAYRLAMYMLLTISSHPVLYEGDEVMQRGWKWNGNPREDPQNPGDGSGIYDETLREPFPWFASGAGPGQTRWFQPRFDWPHDGVSREEQDAPGGMLNLVRGLTHLRAQHPAFANGDVGAIPSDSAEWKVFERFSGNDRYLVLINETLNGRDYRFHAAWYPQYRGADLIFWSDGRQRTWKDTSADGQRIGDSVFVPPVGLVVLRRRT